MDTTTAFTFGDTVEYRGSITEARGNVTFAGACLCDRCARKGYANERVMLGLSDGSTLWHVRKGSVWPTT